MKFCFFLILLFFLACKNDKTSVRSGNAADSSASSSTADKNLASLINPEGLVPVSRIKAPAGYHWKLSPDRTFGAFLEKFPLKPAGAKILKYDGKPIATQNLHAAVFNIDTGDKDLQQCADAIIRLRAEFLKKADRENDIAFHYTSGHLLKWEDFRNGHRLIVDGNKVSPAIVSALPGANSFQNYLTAVFTYAGTISMYQETVPVTSQKQLQSGDILITAGSPGHVVFIAGVAENKKGERLYLLGQGFTPAQSIHILTNPFNKVISPWYTLNPDSPEIKTARYDFKPVSFRRYSE